MMWQLYFRCEFFKNTTLWDTKEALINQLEDLTVFIDGCRDVYVEIINPLGTLVQQVTKNG